MSRPLRATTPLYVQVIRAVFAVLAVMFAAVDGAVLAAAIRVWITLLAPRYAAVAGIWSVTALILAAGIYVIVRVCRTGTPPSGDRLD